MSNAAGFGTHVVRCSSCEELFDIAASTGKEIEKLSDPFEANCPHCGALSICLKSAIEVLEARQAGRRGFMAPRRRRIELSSSCHPAACGTRQAQALSIPPP